MVRLQLLVAQKKTSSFTKMDKPTEKVNPDSPQKNNKFLFDLNDFDKDEIKEIEIIEEEIEVEPPAPTFSEDEMEAAKAIAHSQGLNRGRVEEKQQREQSIADTLNKISENFSSLFAAEIYREKQYEEEALKLGLEIISLLAPSLNNRLGKEALQDALSNVLTRQGKQSEIRVEVDPESAPDVHKHIDTIWTDKDNAPHYKVVANSELEKGECSIHWEDGGMIRNPQKTATKIKEAIEALLVEQVMTKSNSPLTIEENNVINKEGMSDSLETSASENPNGENEND